MLAFAGPAYLVSVGYMDPGNWATDLAGGARFGYQLVWVLVMSNLMAVLLQTLAARLGVVTGRDLAQACRDFYPRALVWPLWILCEIAIVACDLAEVLGAAIGLQLLFHIPLALGVVITVFDVLLLLALSHYGIRRLEAFILTLVATIGGCFAIQMLLSNPDYASVLAHLVPRDAAGQPTWYGLDVQGQPTVMGLRGESLFIAMGILGATVMPHNLYLHSALVQSREIEPTEAGRREACRLNLVDSAIALNAALFVNFAILVLAAAAFFRYGFHEVGSLREAHRLLSPLLGNSLAPTLFAIALLCAGQASTVTGTLAGQIVMEGFLRVRMQPWLRRLVSRGLAVIPALAVILWRGEAGRRRSARAVAGHPVPATRVRGRAAHHVHERSAAHGRVREPMVGEGTRGCGRGAHHRTECQARRRCHRGLGARFGRRVVGVGAGGAARRGDGVAARAAHRHAAPPAQVARAHSRGARAGPRRGRFAARAWRGCDVRRGAAVGFGQPSPHRGRRRTL
jgi:manganese transport protein